MGDLVALLSREDDLVQKIATFLEVSDLQNLELTCKVLRDFMIRAQTWRRKLESDFPRSVLDKTKYFGNESPIELHLKCKRMYAEQEEAAAMLRWRKFCTSWMTIMTISSLYSFLHDPSDSDEVLENDNMLPSPDFFPS